MEDEERDPDERIAPDPYCYGCVGTGFIKWAGIPPNSPCPCTLPGSQEGP